MAPQILAVELEQIEGAMNRSADSASAVAADKLKNGKPVIVANDGLTINRARTDRQLADCHCDEGKAGGKIVSGAGNQPHAGSILASQNAEAIVFDFMQPARA
jgi:hypothetical protein